MQKIKTKLNKGYQDPLFLRSMDLKVEMLKKDKAVLSMACNEHTLSGYGSLYGGIIGFAADIAIWNALLTRGDEPHVVTTDLNTHFLERFGKGRARFEATILRYGARMIMGECKVYNAKNNLAAHVTASFLRVDSTKRQKASKLEKNA